jgi:hypothetical protein
MLNLIWLFIINVKIDLEDNYSYFIEFGYIPNIQLNFI